MNIVWLPAAIGDLERLEEFLTRHDYAETAEISALIGEAVRSLEEFPMRCRRVPGRPEFRELFAEARSQTYVVQFRIPGQHVVVVRVWHSRESR